MQPTRLSFSLKYFKVLTSSCDQNPQPGKREVRHDERLQTSRQGICSDKGKKETNLLYYDLSYLLRGIATLEVLSKDPGRAVLRTWLQMCRQLRGNGLLCLKGALFPTVLEWALCNRPLFWEALQRMVASNCVLPDRMVAGDLFRQHFALLEIWNTHVSYRYYTLCL